MDVDRLLDQTSSILSLAARHTLIVGVAQARNQVTQASERHPILGLKLI